MSKQTIDARATVNNLCRAHERQDETIRQLRKTSEHAFHVKQGEEITKCHEQIIRERKDHAKEVRLLQEHFAAEGNQSSIAINELNETVGKLANQLREARAELAEVSEVEMQSPAMSVTHMRTKIGELHTLLRDEGAEYSQQIITERTQHKEQVRLIREEAANLITSLRDVKERNDSLNKSQRQLQANFDSLTRDNRRIRSDNTTLLGEHARLRAEVKEVKGQLRTRDHSTGLNILNEEVGNLNRELGELKACHNSQVDTIRKLRHEGTHQVYVAQCEQLATIGRLRGQLQSDLDRVSRLLRDERGRCNRQAATVERARHDNAQLVQRNAEQTLQLAKIRNMANGE